MGTGAESVSSNALGIVAHARGIDPGARSSRALSDSCSHSEFRLEPALVEEAVFQCFLTGRRARDERRWNRERESIYLLPVAERPAAFGALALRWFAHLGLERLLERCLDRVPHVRASVLEVALERALGPRAEGSELFHGEGGGEDGLRLVLWVAARRFGDPSALEEFLLQELLRAEDMLDPAFAYRPELGPGLVRGDPRAELVRDRLRALWELRLAGRTARLLGHSGGQPAARVLERAFAGVPASELAALAGRAVAGELASFPELLHLARAEPAWAGPADKAALSCALRGPHGSAGSGTFHRVPTACPPPASDSRSRSS